jgi:CHAP domain
MKILDIAISQIGVTEDAAHTNHGEAIKYQQAAGLGSDGGFPWCQSFVYWCGLQAYGAANPVPKTGGVLDCWHKATNKIEKSDATPENIKAGYQFILKHTPTTGHTGIVESVDADGTLHTIEGNSNDDGSRDGYEVCRLSKRHLTDAQLLGFIVYED